MYQEGEQGLGDTLKWSSIKGQVILFYWVNGTSLLVNIYDKDHFTNSLTL